MSWFTYALISAGFAAATSILAKIGMSNIDSNLATAIRTIVIVVLAWLIVVIGGSAKQLNKLSGTDLIFLILSGVATGLSWLFYFKALQLGKASQVVPIDKLSIVMAMILAVIFLKEKITPLGVAGGALIVTGSIMIARGG